MQFLIVKVEKLSRYFRLNQLTSTASVPLSIRSIFVSTPNVLSPTTQLRAKGKKKQISTFYILNQRDNHPIHIFKFKTLPETFAQEYKCWNSIPNLIISNISTQYKSWNASQDIADLLPWKIIPPSNLTYILHWKIPESFFTCTQIHQKWKCTGT